MVLAITLMMLVVMTMIATTLFQSANLNMMIAANSRRHAISGQAAMSGIHHFEGLGLHYLGVMEKLGDEAEVIIIPMTPLGNTWYEVRATQGATENRFIVVSTGLMKDGGRTIAASTMSATYETIYKEEN